VVGTFLPTLDNFACQPAVYVACLHQVMSKCSTQDSDTIDATGGGYQPRAVLFKVLAMLWVFPSVGAIWILARSAHAWPASQPSVMFQSIAFEEWVAMALLLMHVTFVALAWRLKRTEPYRRIDETETPAG
jgi:hypothetical protein